MRKKLFDIIQKCDDDNKLSLAYDIFMIIIITLSLVPLMYKESSIVLRIIDYICLTIFIIDYILRLVTADYKYHNHSAISFIKYPFSLMAIIDIISILPSFMVLNPAFKALRIFRMIRALRVVRIFKTFRYSNNIRIIIKIFKESKKSLIAVCLLAVAYILISALIIFNVEPDPFNNFFEAVYWATISLTTVGYGDIYPVTTAGRLITMLSSIFGVAIVALPAGVITAGYMREIEMKKR